MATFDFTPMSRSTIEFDLTGKKILIVKGSLLALPELETALAEHGAKPFPTTNLISAFSLLERERIDAAVIDKGLHNEAFEFCAELRDIDVPYLVCGEPHVLQATVRQKSSAENVVCALSKALSARKPPLMRNMQCPPEADLASCPQSRGGKNGNPTHPVHPS